MLLRQPVGGPEPGAAATPAGSNRSSPADRGRLVRSMPVDQGGAPRSGPSAGVQKACQNRLLHDVKFGSTSRRPKQRAGLSACTAQPEERLRRPWTRSRAAQQPGQAGWSSWYAAKDHPSAYSKAHVAHAAGMRAAPGRWGWAAGRPEDSFPLQAPSPRYHSGGGLPTGVRVARRRLHPSPSGLLLPNPSAQSVKSRSAAAGPPDPPRPLCAATCTLQCTAAAA